MNRSLGSIYGLFILHYPITKVLKHYYVTAHFFPGCARPIHKVYDEGALPPPAHE